MIKAENDRDIYLTFDHMETGKIHLTPALSTNSHDISRYLYLHADLHAVIRAGILADIHKKYIIWQLLKALKYLHSAVCFLKSILFLLLFYTFPVITYISGPTASRYKAVQYTSKRGLSYKGPRSFYKYIF